MRQSRSAELVTRLLTEVVWLFGLLIFVAALFWYWLLCAFLRHRWRTEFGEAGNSYQLCDRCGRYPSRDGGEPPSDFGG